jgi:hypothetical protein
MKEQQSQLITNKLKRNIRNLYTYVLRARYPHSDLQLRCDLTSSFPVMYKAYMTILGNLIKFRHEFYIQSVLYPNYLWFSLFTLISVLLQFHEVEKFMFNQLFSEESRINFGIILTMIQNIQHRYQGENYSRCAKFKLDQAGSMNIIIYIGDHIFTSFMYKLFHHLIFLCSLDHTCIY